MRKPRPLPALLAALLAPHAFAQTPPPAPPEGGRLAFVGDTTRAGIGWDSDNRWRGDLWHVLHEDERTAWIGELWLTDRSAGGAKLSYQWRPPGASDAGVRKVFGAFDQNRWHDRKVTLGGGYETPDWFASGYASAGITGRREVGFDSVSSTTTVRGDENGRPFEQDITTTLATRTFERAYDWGVGGRFGHYYPALALRLEAGLDYERGRGSTGQATVSLGAEKYLEGTPFSLALTGEAYRKHGGIEPDRDDARVWVMVRYAFGGNAGWRPEKVTRMVEVPRTAPPPAPPVAPRPVAATPPPTAPAAPAVPAQPRTEQRIVKTTATASADAFFDFDRATLRPEAKSALDTAIARLKAARVEGNIRIAGHTCDLGPAAYNLKLSQRRANAVRDYLVANGLPADRLLAEGIGEAAPRYPNTRDGRPKNRRVDIEFVTFEERTETVTLPAPPAPFPAPAVAPSPAPSAAVAQAPAAPATPPTPPIEWRREEIAAEPTWLRRALRNTAGHKQTVDVYRSVSETTTVTEGPRRYLNRTPVARDDALAVEADSAARPVAVLANDSDPDGDTLAIASVTPPAHGVASVSGTQVLYTPARGYTGPDAFTYTIADGKGGTATATVSVTVSRANRAPVAVDDFGITGFNEPIAFDVLANDSDPDNDALAVLSFTQPRFGTVTRGAGNTLVYRANQDWTGYDSFTYVASDGRGGVATAAVIVFADP